MEISEVRINLNKGGKVKAFAQVIFDGCFLVGDIRVLEGKEGTVYVAMPSRRLRNGAFRDIAPPPNTDTRKRLEGGEACAWGTGDSRGTRLPPDWGVGKW